MPPGAAVHATADVFRQTEDEIGLRNATVEASGSGQWIRSRGVAAREIERAGGPVVSGIERVQAKAPPLESDVHLVGTLGHADSVFVLDHGVREQLGVVGLPDRRRIPA